MCCQPWAAGACWTLSHAGKAPVRTRPLTEAPSTCSVYPSSDGDGRTSPVAAWAAFPPRAVSHKEAFHAHSFLLLQFPAIHGSVSLENIGTTASSSYLCIFGKCCEKYLSDVKTKQSKTTKNHFPQYKINRG